MKYLLFIAFFLLPISLAAQVDKARLRVTYSAEGKKTIEENEEYKDMQVLCIGEKMSLYYSTWTEDYKNYRDSFYMADNSAEAHERFDSAPNVPNRGVEYRIYKNYPKSGILTGTDALGLYFYFLYEEPLPEFNWQMEEGDTIIATYPCHKATTEYHGRKWTAWYSLDLPFDDGPWKLRGLPGLILQASESEGIFSFTCVGIDSGNDRPIAIEKQNYQKCTGKQIEQNFKDFWRDQIGFVHKQLGFPPGAKDEHQGVFTACLLEYYP